MFVLKHDDLPRAFQISKSKGIRLFFGFSGLILSIIAFGISFVPPSQLSGPGVSTTYLTILSVSFVAVLFIPFIIYHFMRKKNPLPAGQKMPDLSDGSDE